MRWIATPPASPSPAHPPLDAILAARINLHSARSETAENPWWSALFDLREVSLNELAEQFAPDDFLIPSVYSPQDRAQTGGRRLVAVFVRHRLLEQLNETGRTFGIFAIKDGMIHSDDMIDAAAQFVEPAQISTCDNSVVMAVIDDGIAFANDLFRDGPTSTRVEHAWVMATLPDKDIGGPSMGRFIDKDATDALLKAHTKAGLLDESAFYRKTGQIDFRNGEFSPVSLRRSHGTHITGVAAGHPMSKSLQTRPIICATLPPRVTQDTTGQSSLPALALALQDLHHQAQRFRTKNGYAPVVMNFSFGNFSGPHDGTGEIDALFAQFLDQCPTQDRHLVLPAGNGNLSQTHAELTFPQDDRDTKDLHLSVPPDDRTATHLQMWMPRRKRAGNLVNIQVTPPAGPTSPPLHADGTTAVSYDLVDDSGLLARLSYSMTCDPINRGLAVLTISPNTSFAPQDPTAPAGDWDIAITPDEIEPPDQDNGLYLPINSVQVWVRRDETLPGFSPGGRQAILNDPDYVRFGKYGERLATDPKGSKSLVRRAGTLSGFACGKAPVVIGGCIAKDLSLPAYSAAGPITPYSEDVETSKPKVARDGPTVVSRSDDSTVLTGIISSGSTCGSFVRLNGTSVAAPAIARLIADELAGKPKSSPHPIEASATRAGKGFVPVDIALLDLPKPILEPFPTTEKNHQG